MCYAALRCIVLLARRVSADWGVFHSSARVMCFGTGRLLRWRAYRLLSAGVHVSDWRLAPVELIQLTVPW